MDVATKTVGVALLEHSVIGPGWARLRVVRNSGFAFGMGASWSDGMVLGVTVIVVLGVGVAAFRGGLMGPVPAGLILGGALANVLDRAVDGSVVDLIDIGPWPTFNLADTFIVIGMGLLAVGGGSMTGSPREPPETGRSGVSNER